MPLPPFTQWQDARPVLHQAAQILNAARVASLDPLPNALRHSLTATPSGATTGPLKGGARLTLDYVQGSVILEADDAGEIMRVAVNDHTQQTLFRSVFAAMTQAGYALKPDDSKITGTALLTLNPAQGQLYAGVQWRMVQMLALVKARMFGPQHPLVLWPHGFDLSTLWFVNGMDESRDPHLNFGFSPGTPDVGQPYVYFYAYPELPELRDQMPRLFTWATGWHSPGGYIRYEQFAHETDPESLLLDGLATVYDLASAMLKNKAG